MGWVTWLSPSAGVKSMRIAVLGAGGGLGRNVVDAARNTKHDVVALVRDPKTRGAVR